MNLHCMECEQSSIGEKEASSGGGGGGGGSNQGSEKDTSGGGGAINQGSDELWDDLWDDAEVVAEPPQRQPTDADKEMEYWQERCRVGKPWRRKRRK
jgi:hypothetical protein